MKLSFKLIIAFLVISAGLHAQGVDDAIYHLQTRYEGTARSMAMGGATGAMGGDLTSICINPAGLGLYRGSEIAFTLGLQQTATLSSYYGNDNSGNRMRVTIPNMGFVLSGNVSNYKPLRYFQLAVTLNRTNDFNYRSVASGVNPNSSLVDTYLQTANGIDDLLKPYINPGNYLADNFPYDLSPAWETFLIDRFVDDSTGQYFFNSPVPPGNVNQEDIVLCRGRSEEWTIALAANYFDRLFVGASMGVNHMKRISQRDYTETGLDGSFDNWTHREDLSDTIWGINFKCGLIYYPAPWLRVGAAWHSRTLNKVGEVWSTETATKIDRYRKYLSPTLHQTYQFHTPHTFTGSVAFILSNSAMLTADVDYLNYGDSWFSSNEYDDLFDGTNEDISEILKPSCNIRLGIEWRFRQYFFRGGAAYYGSPYGFGERYGSMKKLGLGFGYSTSSNFVWDFAYELSGSTLGYTPYQYVVDGENIVEDIVLHQWRNKVVATIKFKL